MDNGDGRPSPRNPDTTDSTGLAGSLAVAHTIRLGPGSPRSIQESVPPAGWPSGSELPLIDQSSLGFFTGFGVPVYAPTMLVRE